MPTPVRKFIKHTHRIKSIVRSSGATFACPFISGSYMYQLQDIGEFEITIPNGWVKDQDSGIQKLTRNEIAKYDVIQIIRDSTVVFSGIVLKIKRRYNTITISGPSEAWLLTKQHTPLISYTEEPATTVKRFLKGYDYKIKDAFANLDDWTNNGNHDWSIVASQAVADPDTTGSNDNALMTHDTSPTAAEWDEAIIEFDIEDITYAGNDLLDFFVIWARVDATDSRMFNIQVNNESTGPNDFSTSFFLKVNETTPAIIETSYETALDNSVLFTGGNIKIVITGLSVEVFIDGVSKMVGDFTGFPSGAGDLRLRALESNSDTQITIDNLHVRTSKQLISEGTIDNFGSNKTTKVSYETLYKAIDERIRKQLASTESNITWWEWKENPVAYVDSSTPCANMDFKNRIGSDKDIQLSVTEQNLRNFESEENWESFVTDILALGAGNADAEGTGQNFSRAVDFDAYTTSGFILESIYQLSEEQTIATLKAMAALWLGRRATFHENIQVDPVDYESKGFDIGDAYKIKIPELNLDGLTSYRIINERRDFRPEGAETVTVNWKDKTRSFRDALRDELRQQKSKARYDQGTYIIQNFNKGDDESLDDDDVSTINMNLNFTTALYSGVKKVIWNFEQDSGSYLVLIDSVDRTDELFGAATVNTDKTDVDITRFLTRLTTHTITLQNKNGDTQSFNLYGDCELYTI